MSKSPNVTAAVVLLMVRYFGGRGFATTKKVGEICFNTSMTGYQESLTDHSAGQIITFTFPHIGNVGVNDEDLDPSRPIFQAALCGQPQTPLIFAPSIRLIQVRPKLTSSLWYRHPPINPLYPHARCAQWRDCKFARWAI